MLNNLFMKKITYIVSTILLTHTAFAQVGIGTSSPHPSSILDIESSTKGFLPPRVSSDSEVSTPAEGLVIYDESDNCLNVYSGTAWINICANSGSSTGGGGSSSSININCPEVYNNPRSFGIYNVDYGSANTGTNIPFPAHISEDGTSIYSNSGHVYDVNFTKDVRDNNGSLNGSVKMFAINQMIPNKTWKDFYLLDIPSNHWPGVIYLLSDDGELHSMALSEHTSSSHQLNLRTDLVTGGSNNGYTFDPNVSTSNSQNTNDYRFTPHQHLVDDVDASIKFSSIQAITFKQGSSGTEYVVYPYDNVNKKFYSMGVKTSSSWSHTSQTASRLQRTVSPSNLKESITLKEADKINAVIAHYGTEFDEGDGVNVTFTYYRFGGSTSTDDLITFLTKDGILNVIRGNNIYRLALSGGVKIISMSGAFTSPVLGDDGNIYGLSNNWGPTGAEFNTSSISVPGVGSMTEVTLANTPGLAHTNTTVNNLNIKRYARSGSIRHVLTTDGHLYKINASQVLEDISTTRNIPVIDDIFALKEDLLVKNANGDIFGVITNGALRNDLPQIMAPSAIGIDGYPLLNSDLTANGVRIPYNCIGN